MSVPSFDDAVLQIESFVEHDRDTSFAHQRLHDLFGHMRFEGPHRVFARLLPLAHDIPSTWLELPGFRALVVLPHAPVELACDATNGLLVADVGGTQSSAGQSAEVSSRLNQYAQSCPFDAPGQPPPRRPTCHHRSRRRVSRRRRCTGRVAGQMQARRRNMGVAPGANVHVSHTQMPANGLHSPMILISTRLGRFPSNSP